MPDANTAGRIWSAAEVVESWTRDVPLKDAPGTVATGVKHDTSKPPMDLLDPLAMEGIANVLDFGASKYSRSNWRGGISHSRLVAAALRHIMAYNRGEDLDPESGLSHIDHAACCVMFLANMIATRPDLDDRYKEPK